MISLTDISVVIPTWNEQTRIADAIGSAAAAGAGEIVVSDGGSQDDTVAVARRAGATRVIQAEPGRGSQLAAGANAARGKMLVFLHADNQLTPQSLQQVVDCADAGTTEVWGAMRQRIESPRSIFRWIEWGNALRVRFRKMPFGDQAIFVHRALYERVGGFEEVPLMEDVRLATKLRKIARPRLIPGPVIVDARRWDERGPIKQTALNVRIQLAHAVGVREETLASWYRGGKHAPSSSLSTLSTPDRDLHTPYDD